MAASVTRPLDRSNVALVEAVRNARRLQTEATQLRDDNAHLLRTAQQAATAAAQARHERQIFAGRLNAIDHYMATVDIPDQMRADIRALIHGQHEPGRD